MKNMKKYLNLLIAVLLIGSAFGQDDKAKAVLDKVSAKTNAYKSVIISFDLTITGPEMTTINETGKAYLEGDKYKIELSDQDIYCDGVTMSTHLKLDGECYSSKVAETATEDMIMPSELLTIWEEGYKYQYIKETTYKGVAVHHINLFPKDAAKSKFTAIILKIDKEKNEVVSVLIKGKDGVNMKYDLTKLEKNVAIPVSTFVFDRAKHPDVECYDE